MYGCYITTQDQVVWVEFMYILAEVVESCSHARLIDLFNLSNQFGLSADVSGVFFLKKAN